MQFRRIHTPSLALYSYLIADGQKAAVIDPRTDVRVYLETARDFGTKIVAIFETHRNEDFISGASALGELTGAAVYHSAYEEHGHNYGKPIDESFRLQLDTWMLRPVHTPGHTLGHLSFLLAKESRAYMLFSGDTLFYGDIGRTDFYGESELERMTGLLYDSIYQKILPLGDGVLLMPAHGPGSACGGKIEDRPYSTLGYEKANSPALQVRSKAEFVKLHAVMHPKPPYMGAMEKANLEAFTARDFLGNVAVDPSLEGRQLIDLRPRRAFLGGHLPGSIWINAGILNAHLGWQVSAGWPLTFITEGMTRAEIEDACMVAACMGYQDLAIYPSGLLKAQDVEGNPLQPLTEIAPADLIAKREEYFLLDVRRPDEILPDDLKSDRNIPVGVLGQMLKELPREASICALCGSGERATVAASVLQMAGFHVQVIAGGNRAVRSLAGLE